MRVLIVTPNISTRMGGEAVLPYHYIRELSQRGVELHAATHARVRDEIISSPIADLATFHFVEDTWIERAIFRLGQAAPASLRDSVFNSLIGLISMMRLANLAKQLARENRFEIIHQPTPVSPVIPSFLTNIEAPTIIGPMNGGMNFPSGFKQQYGKGSEVTVKLARTLSGLLNWAFAGKKKASRILVANDRTQQGLPKSIQKEQILALVENGVDLDLWMRAPAHSPEVPVFIFAGRLVWWKAVDILIDAFIEVPAPAKLVIIGDGPDRAALQERVPISMRDRIIFTGFLPQSTIRDHMASATALVLPSLRECGGAVILEAFACSLPAIATDWGGPQDYITPHTGLLIPPHDRPQFVQAIRGAMIELAANPEKAALMGAAARNHVEANFSWAAKADKMIAIYKDVIAAAES